MNQFKLFKDIKKKFYNAEEQFKVLNKQLNQNIRVRRIATQQIQKENFWQPKGIYMSVKEQNGYGGIGTQAVIVSVQILPQQSSSHNELDESAQMLASNIADQITDQLQITADYSMYLITSVDQLKTSNTRFKKRMKDIFEGAEKDFGENSIKATINRFWQAKCKPQTQTQTQPQPQLELQCQPQSQIQCQSKYS